MAERDLRSVPGTIIVCGLIVGYIAWLEGRNILIRAARRIRRAVSP